MEIKKSLENKFNTSLANLTGSPIREFDRFASSIDGIIKLTLGEPDFDTAEEIKEALFSIPDNKSPGPDGFSSDFFKHSWWVVGAEIIDAVKKFFGIGKMSKQVNFKLQLIIEKC